MSDVFGAGQAISGGLQAAASINAANVAADAAKHATNLQQQRYQSTREDLAGYNIRGQAGQADAFNLLSYQYPQQTDQFSNTMMNAIPAKTLDDVGNYLPAAQNNSVVPGSMSQAELEATPGYQFALAQGQKAVASSAAARGLGVSGAALKGAASYATGLADQTYKDQFAIKQQQFADQLSKDQQNFSQGNTNFNNVLNLRQGQFNQGQSQLGDINTIANFDNTAMTNRLNYLSNFASLGENAAAQTGSTGANLATAAGNQAIATAGTIGNTISNGATGISNALTNYQNYQQQNKLLDRYFNQGTENGNFGGAGSSEYENYAFS